MADYPYMPLWTDAYLADTRHLSTEQHGAYLLLLMEAWRRPNCSLPNDPDFLSRLAGLTRDRWDEISGPVLDMWSLDKRRNEVFQKRQKEERKKSTKKSRVSRNSARTRWHKKKKDDANAMRSQCYPEPEPDITKTPPIPPNEITRSMIPPDAVPSEKNYLDAATIRGLSKEDSDAAFAHFRDHHRGNGTTRQDWDSAWAAWLRSDYFAKPRRKAARRGGLKLDAFAEAARDFEERRGG